MFVCGHIFLVGVQQPEKRGLILWAPNVCLLVSNGRIASLQTSCVQHSFLIGYMRRDPQSPPLITTRKLTDTKNVKLKVMHREIVCEMLFSYAEKHRYTHMHIPVSSSN